jgi:hypothetical protein
MSFSTSRLIRSNFSCHALPTEVKTWCIVCRYETIYLSSEGVSENLFLDTMPQWTKEEHAVYVERIPQCENCAPANTRFVSVNESIPTTSLEQLRDFEMDHLLASEDRLTTLWEKYHLSILDFASSSRPGSWSSFRILTDVDSNRFLLAGLTDLDISLSLLENDPTTAPPSPGIENIDDGIGFSSGAGKPIRVQPTNTFRESAMVVIAHVHVY